MFEDIEIEIHCPQCDTNLEVMLGQIARQEKIACPGCGKCITLRPDEKPNPPGSTADQNPVEQD